MAQHSIDEGYDPQTGVRTIVHFEDGQIVHQKIFDAEPYLKAAAEARAANAGKSWGDGKKIGTLPPLALARIQQIPDRKEREAAIISFFRENPAFLHFERAIL
jgi:hypothetical protein